MQKFQKMVDGVLVFRWLTLTMMACLIYMFAVLENMKYSTATTSFLFVKALEKNGIPFYEDESKQMGLDFSGFSTQAAFLDYDMDGDLDMYL